MKTNQRDFVFYTSSIFTFRGVRFHGTRLGLGSRLRSRWFRGSVTCREIVEFLVLLLPSVASGTGSDREFTPDRNPRDHGGSYYRDVILGTKRAEERP